MKSDNDFRRIIQQMPKVELHLHLEGAFTFDVLLQLINKCGGDPSIQTTTDLEDKFIFKDFSHFIETWFWKNQFFRQAEDFEISTYATLEHLYSQHVIYAEVFYSPWDFKANGVSVAAITEATLSAAKRAEQDFGIRCRLIPDLCRDYGGGEKAIERLHEVMPYLGEGVIGIGLGGSEQRFPPELFEDVYKLAKKQGFHVVAHAGEAAGPESVWAVIQKLEVERIGHGVRAVEDNKLVNTLREKQIPLEVCITSNLKTGVFPSLVDHPIRYFFEQGLFVTINSDDPAMFGATITDEYLLLYEQLNFSAEEIKKLTVNAMEGSFLSEMEKKNYNQQIEDYWRMNQNNSFIDRI